MLQIATLGLAYQQTPQSKSRTGRYTNQEAFGANPLTLHVVVFYCIYMEQNIAAINGPDLPLKVTQVSQWKEDKRTVKHFDILVIRQNYPGWSHGKTVVPLND